MAENRFAHGASARAAADEHAPLLPNPNSEAAPAGTEPTPAQAEDEHAFASQAEEESYWAGVADGIRQTGGTPPPRLAARAAKEQLLVQVHGDQILPEICSGKCQSEGLMEDCVRHPSTTGSAGGPPPPAQPGEDRSNDILSFTPTQLRARHDGWTPQKQIEFVEALADTGIVRAAAARVGMSEHSVYRLRRRADARAFDRACDGALRIGARRLVSVGYERAIEGTIRRHYFHGELKAEERVYDNRLLIALINKLPDMSAADARADQVAANWEPWMDAIEQGLPAPPAPPEPASAEELFEGRVWTEDGELLTDCPPPADFEGEALGEPGTPFYERTLTAEEELYWLDEGQDAAETDERWGLTFHLLGRPTFFPWGSEPLTPLAPAAEPQDEASGAREPCGESRPSPADGSAQAEPDRRHGFAGTAPAAEPQDEASEAREPCGESRPGPADGSALAEPDRRHGCAGTAPAAKPEASASEAAEPCGESRPSPADGSASAEPDRRHGFAGTASPADT
jgi:hypothetical protein